MVLKLQSAVGKHPRIFSPQERAVRNTFLFGPPQQWLLMTGLCGVVHERDALVLAGDHHHHYAFSMAQLDMNNVEQVAINGAKPTQLNGHLPTNGMLAGTADRLQIVDDQKNFTLVHLLVVRVGESLCSP